MTRATFYAERLREALDADKITARELAGRVGVSEGAVSRWLSGSRVPEDDHRIAIARALDRRVLDLFPFVDEAGELVA